MLLLLLATLGGLATAAPALAQIGVYGQFSASDFNVPGIDYQYGSTFGAYYDRWAVPFFRLGVDARGSVIGSGVNTLVSGTVGPRLVFKPHVLPLMPYVEALGGGAHAEVGPSAFRTAKTGFAYNLVGGLDYTFFPRLDWRVEFSYGGLANYPVHFAPRIYSTGIVFRLP